jgi:hypothetical protein
MGGTGCMGVGTYDTQGSDTLWNGFVNLRYGGAIGWEVCRIEL